MPAPPHIEFDVPPDSTSLSAFAEAVVSALQVTLHAGTRHAPGNESTLLDEVDGTVGRHLDQLAEKHQGEPKSLQGIEAAREVVRKAVAAARPGPPD